MNTITKIVAAGALLLLAACDVKDPIFDTPHPSHGTVTLTTDWSSIGAGLTVPESYTVAAAPKGSAAPDAEYSATLTGITNRLDHLFAPGTYRFLVHNTAEHITVSGTTATVASTIADAPAYADGAGPFVYNAPGWLFSSATDLAITQDTEHTLTTAMQQQVRQFTIILELTGGSTDRIERIEGYLTGAASTLDLATGTHSAPINATLHFAPITSGPDAGRWSATVRLLGIAGPQQKLSARIYFADDNPEPVPLDSDLTPQLAAFNTAKHTPLTLNGTVVETPTGAHFGATINNWIPVSGGPVVAE